MFSTSAQSKVVGTEPKIYLLQPTSADVYGSSIELKWKFYDKTATPDTADNVINFTLTDPEGKLAISEKNMTISNLSTSYTYVLPAGVAEGDTFIFTFSIYYTIPINETTNQLMHYTVPVTFTWTASASSGNITTYIIVAVVIIGLIILYFYLKNKKGIDVFSGLRNKPQQPIPQQPLYYQPNQPYPYQYPPQSYPPQTQPQYQPYPQMQQPQPLYYPIPPPSLPQTKPVLQEKPKPTKISKNCDYNDKLLNEPICKKEYIDLFGEDGYKIFEREQRPIFEEQQRLEAEQIKRQQKIKKI